MTSPSPAVQPKPQLLIVEDQEAIRTQLQWAFGQEFQTTVASDAPGAIRALAGHKPAVVALDLGLPPDPSGTSEGMRLLSEILSRSPLTKVVVITGAQGEQAAHAAIRRGAFDYYEKPIVLPELRTILKRASHIHRLERANDEAQVAMEGTLRFEELIGASAPMRALFTLVEKVAASASTVLINGESGTGKELIARAIHQRSTRREGRFVAIHGGAIPETLLEAELFGHEKGAFTGAHVRRQGRLELADGGTLFLDEVGDLPPAIQVKLLRFLQERQMERIGGRELINVDARIIAGTNSDLVKAVASGRFREDLYYRLGVVTVPVPPLRERGEDVLLLAATFLKRFAASSGGRHPRGFSPEAAAALRAHAWPGNVRELENRVQRALVVASGVVITPADLELAPATPAGLTLRASRDRVERQLVVEALVRCKGNVTRASQEIEVTRPTFHALLNKFGLKTEDFRVS